MKEVIGNLFDYPADAIVIPTNTTVKRNGHAVMGAGVAKEAARRWPWLPATLGARIRRDQQRAGCTFFEISDAFTVACLPTKRNWRAPSDLDLIRVEAGRLVFWAELSQWQTVALPRLGCGLGGLAWPDVKAVLAPLLDDRFVVCHPEAAGPADDLGEGE